MSLVQDGEARYKIGLCLDSASSAYCLINVDANAFAGRGQMKRIIGVGWCGMAWRDGCSRFHYLHLYQLEALM